MQAEVKLCWYVYQTMTTDIMDISWKCDLRQRQLMVVPVWLIHNMLIILDSIAYIGPSVTTYQQLNPGYRIYEVDGHYVNSSRVK